MMVASTAVRDGGSADRHQHRFDLSHPDGPVPGAGSILASIVTASGVELTLAGKPHEPIAQIVRDVLGPTGIVVGDRLDTDGEFAPRSSAYEFGLALSGVRPRRRRVRGDCAPELIASDLHALVHQALLTVR